MNDIQQFEKDRPRCGALYDHEEMEDLRRMLEMRFSLPLIARTLRRTESAIFTKIWKSGMIKLAWYSPEVEKMIRNKARFIRVDMSWWFHHKKKMEMEDVPIEIS